MKLYLIKHGRALPEEKDPKKSLSQEGRLDSEKMAKFLQSKNIKVACIWHSKKKRSIQTAQIISQFIASDKVTERDDLNPLDLVKKFPEEILKAKEDLIIVGHLPFLEKLASLLLTGQEDFELVCFKYSGVLCLEHEQHWKITWFLTPDMI